MRIDFGLDRRELIALDRTVMAEVEAQPLGRDDRTRLTHVGAEDFAQRGMHQMRRGVVAFDIAAPRFVDLRDRGRRLERLTECPHDGAPAIDFVDAFDRQLPAVARDHAGVTDLATGLRVERILLENQLELVAGLPKRDRLRLRFG